MKTKNNTPKETDAAKQETEVALDGATCSASVSDTPQTDAMIHKWNCEKTHPVKRAIEAVAYAQKLERVLSKFLAVTATGNKGITEMATIEGRVEFYGRVRAVRAEAHEIIPPNAEMRDRHPQQAMTEKEIP